MVVQTIRIIPVLTWEGKPVMLWMKDDVNPEYKYAEVQIITGRNGEELRPVCIQNSSPSTRDIPWPIDKRALIEIREGFHVIVVSRTNHPIMDNDHVVEIYKIKKIYPPNEILRSKAAVEIKLSYLNINGIELGHLDEKLTYAIKAANTKVFSHMSIFI